MRPLSQPRLIFSALLLSSFADAASYRPDGQMCDGFPRLPIRTERGTCVGLVAQGGPLRKPRKIIEGPGTGGELFFIIDKGTSVADKDGKLISLRLKNSQAKLQTLLENLIFPHGLSLGPDGKIYVGEFGRIFRIPATGGLTVPETVVTLPAMQADSMHPMTHFAFGRSPADQWDLYVNRGAPNDACADHLDAEGRCRLVTEEHLASLLRYRYLGNDHWSAQGDWWARGLRNSMGLVSHPTGSLVQLDNARNNNNGIIRSATEPYDELNLIKKDGDYGWPYCMNFQDRSPEWKKRAGFECAGSASRFEKPWVLLPPHSAPLDAVYAEGRRFAWLKKTLLVSFHGLFAGAGHRVVAYPVDGQGRPVLTKRTATFRWTERGKTKDVMSRPGGGLLRAAQPRELIGDGYAVRGLRPRFAPVGILEATDGAVWIADDENAAILRFSTGKAFRGSLPSDAEFLRRWLRRIESDAPAMADWRDVSKTVLGPKCQACHDFSLPNLLAREDWLPTEKAEESLLLCRVRGSCGVRMPPNSPSLSQDEIERLNNWINRVKTLVHGTGGGQ